MSGTEAQACPMLGKCVRCPEGHWAEGALGGALPMREGASGHMAGGE